MSTSSVEKRVGAKHVWRPLSAFASSLTLRVSYLCMVMHICGHTHARMHTLPLTPLPFTKTLTPVNQQKCHKFSFVPIPFPQVPSCALFPRLISLAGASDYLASLCVYFFHPYCQSLTPFAHLGFSLCGMLPLFHTNSHSDLKGGCGDQSWNRKLERF